MSKPKMVKQYTKEALALADAMPKETYKALKHMDKVQLCHYIDTVYKNGYKAGYQAGLAAPRPEEAPAAEPTTPENASEGKTED